MAVKGWTNTCFLSREWPRGGRQAGAESPPLLAFIAGFDGEKSDRSVQIEGERERAEEDGFVFSSCSSGIDL